MTASFFTSRRNLLQPRSIPSGFVAPVYVCKSLWREVFFKSICKYLHGTETREGFHRARSPATQEHTWHVRTSPQGASEAGLHSESLTHGSGSGKAKFPDRAATALWPFPSAFLFENDILRPRPTCTPRWLSPPPPVLSSYLGWWVARREIWNSEIQPSVWFGLASWVTLLRDLYKCVVQPVPIHNTIRNARNLVVGKSPKPDLRKLSEYGFVFFKLSVQTNIKYGVKPLGDGECNPNVFRCELKFICSIGSRLVLAS